MAVFPKSLQQKLQLRNSADSLRMLPTTNTLIDFCSNDYLGFASSAEIASLTSEILKPFSKNGATGSRLITGNHHLYKTAEDLIAGFHQSENALLFNSGYDANLGFFSSVPQRGDIILYDSLCHASIRDGIRLSAARALKFRHNDLEDLEMMLQKFHTGGEIYIATESVFSMDGDSPALVRLADLSDKYNCRLVLDEAHALGVFGVNGSGLAQEFNLQDRIFARTVTFGKALGCHGAAILGSTMLREYLINFARSFIYTTGLPPHAVATIIAAYDHLQTDQMAINKLRENILAFSREININGLQPLFVRGKSAIQSAIIPGNGKVRSIAKTLQNVGFDVRPILSPTVPEGQERLRICLHSFNNQTDISQLLKHLASEVF